MNRRSLGNNKPRNGYGKEGRSTEARLARHYQLMNEFIAQGMSLADASAKAMRIVSGKEAA